MSLGYNELNRPVKEGCSPLSTAARTASASFVPSIRSCISHTQGTPKRRFPQMPSTWAPVNNLSNLRADLVGFESRSGGRTRVLRPKLRYHSAVPPANRPDLRGSHENGQLAHLCSLCSHCPAHFAALPNHFVPLYRVLPPVCLSQGLEILPPLLAVFLFSTSHSFLSSARILDTPRENQDIVNCISSAQALYPKRYPFFLVCPLLSIIFVLRIFTHPLQPSLLLIFREKKKKRIIITGDLGSSPFSNDVLPGDPRPALRVVYRPRRRHGRGGAVRSQPLRHLRPDCHHRHPRDAAPVLRFPPPLGPGTAGRAPVPRPPHPPGCRVPRPLLRLSPGLPSRDRPSRLAAPLVARPHLGVVPPLRRRTRRTAPAAARTGDAIGALERPDRRSARGHLRP
ncbi:hypothetical protein VTK73DRAFT_2245 [Phialemonium thermophilum]|uniref:Uncharacterized protein n=1 Tax=Phialemonium thermophilum TaxID=223376 RepID=A0ABR3VSE2_9PEZI